MQTNLKENREINLKQFYCHVEKVKSSAKTRGLSVCVGVCGCVDGSES